ncbi:DUF58 domain-containing protein [Xanthomonas dyei]|uniref:DUF58 domain-containing protein n=1 Tax=Xanthomonas dyei TaxID=743699 RepID=A0A2S7BXG7_9XANT|nr:DUF58 domain-containing protein [Xanthomonas dyei]MCC4634403.1 DUF58 domain-containing protein [Xanthomonas dyei pv. eucalypti]PPU54026.1 DUF58 domain-containing protein [Xanthomonas dyei]
MPPSRPTPMSSMPSSSPANPASSVTGDGLRPSLAELIALRGTALHRGQPGSGRHGLLGPVPAATRGRGMEYAESREYVAGDDARHIDWRVTARTGRAHTKLFQAERERLSLIVADTSPALFFGTRVRYKSVQAARAGAVAAWLAQRQGDRIAALRGTASEAPIAPRSGQRGVLPVLDALARWYAQPPSGDAGLEVALDHAARLLRPGARLTVLADARSASKISATRWSGLALHHEVVVIVLVDPLELSPPARALSFDVRGERIAVDLGSQAARARWQAEFVAPLQQLATLLQSRGVRLHRLSTDDASDAWLSGGTLMRGA